jgi:hypothetical protein
MDWIDHSGIDFDERDTVAFTGNRIGTGIDGEPLVMPDGQVVERIKTLTGEGNGR